MEEINAKDLEKLKRMKRRVKSQNDASRMKYDKISASAPKGTAERIKALSGESVNTFIKRVVLEELDRLEQEQDEERKPPATCRSCHF